MDTRDNTSRSPSSEPADLERQREELRLWAQKNKAFLDIFLDAFAIVDTTNTVIDFNIAFTELCGESYRKILKIGDFSTLLKLEQSPSQMVFDSKKAIRMDEVKGSSKAFPHLQLIIGGIPLFSEPVNDIIGALLTIRNVSAESELQKKYYERKEESVMDGLTRLFNKVYTEMMLDKFVKTALREPNVNITVMMCDIDHFKKVNDTYGHQAGDHVLTTVAQLLKGESRESDIVGRFGGEEFMAILYSTDQPGAKVFAERFRKRIETTKILFSGKHIPVTVSLGTSTFNKRWERGSDNSNAVKTLIAQADAALYFSKANGRNQTCQFENLPTEQASAAANAATQVRAGKGK